MDRELATSTELALDGDGAAHLTNDPVTDREPEPVPTPIGLVVKNGVKSLLLISSVIPSPCH